MASKRKQHVEEEEHENAERWLLTYADMITLLVAFFIMMYSMSVMDMKKFSEVAIAIRSGFMGELSGTGSHPLPKSVSGTDRDVQPIIAGMADSPNPYYGHAEGTPNFGEKTSITQYIKNQFAILRLNEAIQPVLDIAANEGNRFVVIVTDQIIFDHYSAAITSAAADKLRKVGNALKKNNVKILLDGYSSAVTTNSGSSFQDSWQLSAERTRQAANFLVDELKINPRRVTLANYGEWKTPDRSKCLQMDHNGEWRTLVSTNSPDVQDRVVLSIILE